MNGHEIVFAGLDDVEKLKSITFSNGELTDIWIEEASEIQYADFTQLDIRLRGIGIKHQFTITFNPIDINHWLKKHFFDKDNEQVEIFHSTYKTNSFLDENYMSLLESYKENDPYYYEVYCLGHWGVLGKTIFDARAVQNRLQDLQKPIRVGEFIFNYDGNKITDIRWKNDPNGYIQMYDVPNRYTYCIGGDTSGEGSDWFTGQVINAETGKQVATLRHQFDADVYARQMYCLGMYYNNALIGIESNFDSYPIKELQRLGYKNQYIREKEDTYTGKIEKAYGFRTTSVTRPVIISELVKIVREETHLLNNKETLEEMLTFVRNEKGRPEAQEGAHDDLVFGLAIAYRVREQVVMNNEPINIMQKFNFKVENRTDKDWGETIKPI
jgi:phage terminase large subunit